MFGLENSSLVCKRGGGGTILDIGSIRGMYARVYFVRGSLLDVLMMEKGLEGSFKDAGDFPVRPNSQTMKIRSSTLSDILYC